MVLGGRFCACFMVILATGGCCLPKSKPAKAFMPKEADTFSLVVLPDTQKYVETPFLYGLFTAQTQWIADKEDDLNIAFVLHAGDIVENSGRKQEWERASKALSVLDNKVPYIVAVGNHDLEGPSTFNRTRGTGNYNEHFPAAKYEHQPWYGGRHQPDENDNYYALFEHKHLRFLIISLEFAPPDDVLEWANDVVAAHSDRRVIVLTHCYLDVSCERMTTWGLTNPHNFRLESVNDGEQMWEKFVSRHPNVFLVVSGHCHGCGRLTSVGKHGNPVHQVLANYQTRRWYGRNGWLRIMQFSPQTSTIAVKTYSPYRDKWLTDSDNEFMLDYDMSEPTGQIGLSPAQQETAAAQ